MASPDIPLASSGIFHILSKDVDVAAVFGTKIYPLIAPEGTVSPFVVFLERSADPIETKEGTFERDWVLMDITTVAKTFKASREGMVPVHRALSGFSGQAGDVHFSKIRYESRLLSEWDESSNLYMSTERFRLYVDKEPIV